MTRPKAKHAPKTTKIADEIADLLGLGFSKDIAPVAALYYRDDLTVEQLWMLLPTEAAEFVMVRR